MTEPTTLPWKGLVAPAVMLFVVGLAFSLSMPLLALYLDHRGVSAAMVGLTATGGGLGILVAGLVSPRLLERYGLATAAGLGVVTSAGIFLILPWYVDVYLWLLLRFILGFASAVAFIAGEAWMVQLAPDRVRGRVLAAYGGLLASSFAIGPALIPVIGSEGPTPILVTAVIVLGALLPLIAGRRHA
ncbi:MAG: MFS transporter, partial [Alphaproteobacteria bacterium]|nr:MFS transporter [Alphaproteobacteria bacterium]